MIVNTLVVPVKTAFLWMQKMEINAGSAFMLRIKGHSRRMIFIIVTALLRRI